MSVYSKSALRDGLGGGALVAALLAVASPLRAQDEVSVPESSTLADVQARQKLNQEQAQFARGQLAQNAANQAEYERNLAEYERKLAEFERKQAEVAAAIARIAADDAAAKAAYEAEKARIEAEYSAAMAKWEADVAACKAGDWSRCADG